MRAYLRTIFPKIELTKWIRAGDFGAKYLQVYCGFEGVSRYVQAARLFKLPFIPVITEVDFVEPVLVQRRRTREFFRARRLVLWTWAGTWPDFKLFMKQ